ncbi:MAG: tetratricopeptide repeat protein [Planctomycetota bacterium]|nr:tetratricopeptide repeat protein [Planctomycetota bacterium]
MGLFGKLFGRKGPAPSATPQPPAASLAPQDGGEMIHLLDAYGRPVQITRREWRDKVLRHNIQSAWNEPDKLHDLVVSSLNDGFRAEIIAAAEHLYAIDPNRARTTNLWGVILMEEKRLDEAERVLSDYIASRGNETWILSNLAKVYSNRGNEARADEYLWRSLTADPNNHYASALYVATAKERGGGAAAAATSALRRIAQLPGSWRALLHLAREELDAGRLGDAMTFYRQALQRTPQPAPADLLAKASGDLGERGHLRELVSLVGPQFNATAHGLEVGNNLIKAHVDRGELEEARRILDELFALNRPDWREALGFWDTEIAKARVAAAPPVPPEELTLTMLPVEGPVWLPASSAAVTAPLVPPKPQDELVVAFLGSSATVAEPSDQVKMQMSDGPGRMSRALPLFLAEQTFFATRARTMTMVPWIARGGSGFALFGKAMDDAAVIRAAAEMTPPADFVVAVHLVTAGDPWRATLRVLRASDRTCVLTLDASVPPLDFRSELTALATRLIDALAADGAIQRQPPPPWYQLPAADWFPSYMLRLEQLLAVRCAGMEGVPLEFLSGEREILDGNLQLCLADPTNATTRLLLAQTARAFKRVRQDVVQAFAEKIALLQNEMPLESAAHAAVQQLLE